MAVKQIDVGGVKIGAGAPVSVQSMTNTDTRDAGATLSQIRELFEAGCDIVRVAVPDDQAASALNEICAQSPIPVVADIHFDYRLAVLSARAGAAKIRVNPGNISSRDKLLEITRACKERGIPIRIGVNSGSLPKGMREKHGTVGAMVESALSQMETLGELGFEDVCLSLKASGVVDTYEAYRAVRARTEAPLHLGVTEAGTPHAGVIRSAVGIGALLLAGIGDTVRVSLTAHPVEEVKAGKAILRACGLLNDGVRVISCPTCGRCRMDVFTIAQQVEAALEGDKRPITVAVMGCEVNGPGEASHADVGIAGGKDCTLIFKKGEIAAKVSPELAFERLMEIVREL